MTVQSSTLTIAYTGDGVTTAFNTGYYVLLATDLIVSVGGVVKTNGVDYIVSNLKNQSGSTVTFTVAPAAAASVVLLRSPPQTQLLAVVDNQTIPAQVYNDALDKLTMIAQSITSRSITLSNQDPTPNPLTLPVQSARANSYLAFDGSGNPIAGVGPSGGTVISATMVPVVQATSVQAALNLLTTGASAALTVNATSGTGRAAVNALAGQVSQIALQAAAADKWQISNTAANNFTLQDVANSVTRFNIDTSGNMTWLSGAFTVNGAGVSPWAITGGFLNSIAGNLTTATMTVTAGSGSDQGNTTNLNWGAQSWAASNGNAANGYAGGTTLPVSQTVHMYICKGTSGYCSFASTVLSMSPASAPAGYQQYVRRVGSFYTTGVGPISFSTVEREAGSIQCFLAANVQDMSNVAIPLTRQLYALSVPAGGLRVRPMFRTEQSAAGTSFVSIGSPDEQDLAPNGVGAAGADYAGTGSTMFFGTRNEIITNTSGQIFARAVAVVAGFYLSTFGWVDMRRA